MNPDLLPFLATWDKKWAELPPEATPADRRTFFEVIAEEMRLPTPGDVSTETVHWIESPSGPVRVRVFRYQEESEQPCLIYMHGGAWMQGSPETHWDITSRLASWSRQTVISVDYAKAPERPFPAAFEQCVAAVRWAAQNAKALQLDTSRLMVGGDSAGGNIAAAIALELRDSAVTLAGQLLIYPACDFDQSRKSYAENKDGPIIQVAGMHRVNAMYSPDAWRLKEDWRVAPLAAREHGGLPPAYIAVAECDPLRDSGLAYAEALKRSGVPVTLDTGPGLIHGYLRAMEYCPASVESLKRMAAWISETNAKGQSTLRSD
jgi:acetyl esterase/lipase